MHILVRMRKLGLSHSPIRFRAPLIQRARWRKQGVNNLTILQLVMQPLYVLRGLCDCGLVPVTPRLRILLETPQDVQLWFSKEIERQRAV